MAAIIKIRGDHGRYTAQAVGPHVTIPEVEIVLAGSDGQNDLWMAAGVKNRRRIAVPQEELSWIADGEYREYPYTLIEIQK